MSGFNLQDPDEPQNAISGLGKCGSIVMYQITEILSKENLKFKLATLFVFEDSVQIKKLYKIKHSEQILNYNEQTMFREWD